MPTAMHDLLLSELINAPTRTQQLISLPNKLSLELAMERSNELVGREDSRSLDVEISSESVSEQSLKLTPVNEETELALVQSLKLTLQEASLELSQSVNVKNSSSVIFNSALSCCIALLSPAVIQGAFAHALNDTSCSFFKCLALGEQWLLLLHGI